MKAKERREKAHDGRVNTLSVGKGKKSRSTLDIFMGFTANYWHFSESFLIPGPQSTRWQNDDFPMRTSGNSYYYVDHI